MRPAGTARPASTAAGGLARDRTGDGARDGTGDATGDATDGLAAHPTAGLAADATDDITSLDAISLSRAIHSRRVSCREVMLAYLARIHRLNPCANALVNLVPDEWALAEAERCDAELSGPGGRHRGRWGSRGWMHGFPQAIKDAAHAMGLPTTFGSPLLADAVAQVDSLFVERMKASGAIVIGKTNMPELGLGSHTYNPLFGRTPNAWDASVSAGGSSGGAAVALALRLLPVADGSDFMGSLRNPAGWNHVFGLRPSQGRVPAFPKPELWVSQLATDGPMARTVSDLAALLSTQAGHDARVPLALAAEPRSYVPSAKEATVKGLRIAWLGDLGGYLAMEPGILTTCEAALARLQAGGAHVEALGANEPNGSGGPNEGNRAGGFGFSPEALWEAWLVWRRALVAPNVAALLALRPDARARIKPEALWEHDQAQSLDFATFMRAAQVRSSFHTHLVTNLFERFDLLALPAAQVWPFDLQWDWPRTVAGRTMDTYHRWMEVTLYATFAGLPAISVPAGFHPEHGKWPMGLQLIGRPLADAALVRAAAGYEGLIGAELQRRPG
ncbi:MAG: amidase [Burkholderiales bacterium]|nr:amidase [Burkholderiales bacterium]